MASHPGVLRGRTLSAGVVAAARRRQRRRTLAAAVAIAVAGVGGGVAATLHHAAPGAPVASNVAPAAVLARAPDVGMACLTPAPCDRVGVAVWLRRPAASVSASVAGHPVALEVRAASQFDPG